MTNEELVEQIQNGDRTLMESLWLQVERFVAQQANRFMARKYALNLPTAGMTFDDLYIEGYFALEKAVRSFSADKGSFIGWLAFYLRSAFQAALRAMGGRTYRMNPLDVAVSMDTPLDEGDPDAETLADVVADPSVDVAGSVEEKVWGEELHAAVERELGELTERESAVLRMTYYDERSAGQIAEVLSISEKDVRALQQRSMNRLRQKTRRTLRTLAEQRYCLCYQGPDQQSPADYLAAFRKRYAVRQPLTSSTAYSGRRRPINRAEQGVWQNGR